MTKQEKILKRALEMATTNSTEPCIHVCEMGISTTICKSKECSQKRTDYFIRKAKEAVK